MQVNEKRFQIADVLIDPVQLKLRRDGQWLALEAKQLALLQLLIARIGQAVSRDDIMQTVWPNMIVSDNSVSQLVVQLRKSLGDDKQQPKYIKTIARVGYQLVAEVTSPQTFLEQLQQPVIYKPMNWLGVGVLAGCVAMVVGYFLTQQQPSKPLYSFSSRLTASPGAEVFARFSPDGRFLAYSQVGEPNDQFDLVVYDMQLQTTHTLKSTGYSEELPAWSADGKWLSYYRFDPYSCEVRMMAVNGPVELWRLGAEYTLMSCDESLGPSKLTFTDNNLLFTKLWRPQGAALLAYAVTDNAAFKTSAAQARAPVLRGAMATKNGPLKLAPHPEVVLDLVSDYDIVAQQLLYSVENDNNSGIFQQTLTSGKPIKLADIPHTGLALAPEHGYLSGGNTLNLMRMDVEPTALYRSNGLITEISVAHASGDIVHTEGSVEINLYQLRLQKGEIVHKPMLQSSPSRIDLNPTISLDAMQIAFASQNLQYSGEQAVEIWVKHQKQQSANLVTLLPKHELPKQLLFSPDGEQLAIYTVAHHLYLVNLLSKQPIEIATDLPNLQGVYWFSDSKQLHFASHAGQDKQFWYYSLQTRNRELQEFAKTPQPSQLNASFTEYLTYVEQQLQQNLPISIKPAQLAASLRLYQPALFMHGIYYVLRHGHQLQLYLFDFESQTHRKLYDLGSYLYELNVPLGLSSSADGSTLVFNQIENLQLDLVLQKANLSAP